MNSYQCLLIDNETEDLLKPTKASSYCLFISEAKIMTLRAFKLFCFFFCSIFTFSYSKNNVQFHLMRWKSQQNSRSIVELISTITYSQWVTKYFQWNILHTPLINYYWLKIPFLHEIKREKISVLQHWRNHNIDFSMRQSTIFFSSSRFTRNCFI